jgi:hypothetical protein
MAQSVPSKHWWQALDRRTFAKGAMAFTALLSMSGCKGDEAVNAESLDLQRQHGWNVGAEESRLFFVGISEQDAKGTTDWKQYTDPTRLMEAWRPRTEAWQPFFDPTLMQALQANSLREQMRPIVTTAMRDAFGRGEALRTDLLSQVTKGPETLFIADLPGPEAVAFGAGLASWADLLPGFANWPHPFGVVRSHETLAALLYYAAYVQERKQQLPASAPGLLLLDSQRLQPYTDDGKQFDNRYVAVVPPVSALQQRGIKQVMYITPDRQQRHESDDLNDDFVAYRDASIQVVLFPLADLQKTSEAVAKKAPDGSTHTVQEPRYYYGGGLESHLGFLLLYSFLAPRPSAYYYYPGPTGAGGRTFTLGQTSRPSTPPPSYQPTPRSTMFSGTRLGGASGVGRTKPSGFGRTTVRTSGGRVTGIGAGSGAAGAASGRSGSFGRGGAGGSTGT